MSESSVGVPAFAWPAEMMTVRQVADTVLLTPKTVRQHIRAGRLRAVRFGERSGSPPTACSSARRSPSRSAGGAVMRTAALVDVTGCRVRTDEVGPLSGREP